MDLETESLIIIPGNHDIEWTKPADEKYDATAKVTTGTPDAAKKAYVDFYRELMRHEPNEDLSMGRRFVFPRGVVLDVCALNSSGLEYGKNFLAGMGRVPPLSFAKVRSALDWDSPDGFLSLRLLALHHHLTATENVEDPAEYYKGFGMAIDAKETLREAATAGVHLVLHGHRHRTFIWREGVYALPDSTETEWRLGNVSLLGGGSVGSSDVEAASHFFNLITVQSDGIYVEMYRSQKQGSFKAINKWTAPFGIEEKRLRLGDWVRD